MWPQCSGTTVLRISSHWPTPQVPAGGKQLVGRQQQQQRRIAAHLIEYRRCFLTVLFRNYSADYEWLEQSLQNGPAFCPRPSNTGIFHVWLPWDVLLCCCPWCWNILMCFILRFFFICTRYLGPLALKTFLRSMRLLGNKERNKNVFGQLCTLSTNKYTVKTSFYFFSSLRVTQTPQVWQ